MLSSIYHVIVERAQVRDMLLSIYHVMEERA